MPRLFAGLLFLLMAASAFAAEQPTAPFKPYFASMRSSQVNMRVGPSRDHPIAWVYHRKGLPVKVVDIQDEWRHVRDPNGDKGWILKAMLSPARTVYTTSKVSSLRSNPDSDAPVIVQIESGVVCKLRACNSGWCQVDVADHRGWLSKKDIWGVEPEEVFEK